MNPNEQTTAPWCDMVDLQSEITIFAQLLHLDASFLMWDTQGIHPLGSSCCTPLNTTSKTSNSNVKMCVHH